MAGVAYYRLVDCCNADNFILINIPVSPGIVADGIYTFTTDIPNVGGSTFDIVAGDCYILTYQSSPFNQYPPIPFATFILQQAGTFFDCTAAAGCPDCNTGQYYIKADPCCGGIPIFLRGEPYVGGSQGGSMPAFSITNYDGIYLIIAPNQPGQFKGLIRGDCYTFSHGVVGDGLPGAPADLSAYNLLDYPPSISQIQFMHPDDCTHVNPDVPCPDCNPICYLLTNCDGTTIQTTIEDFAVAVGSYVTLDTFTGSWFVQINEGVCTDPVLSLKITDFEAEPCPCDCYEVISAPGLVTYIDCEGRPQSTYAPDKFCAQAPPLAKEIPLLPSAVIINQGPCEDGECPDRCFQLINCDPEKYPDQNAIITSTLQSLYQYINPSSVVELAGYDGCWTVIEATCLCISIDINGTVYEANYTGSTYNNNKVFAFEVQGVTYHIWAGITPGTWFITEIVGDLLSAPLAEIKVGILDCPIADSTVWSLTGAWRLNDGTPVSSISTTECTGEEACDCPVDVTVTQDYRTCEECIGPVAYKLTNCDGGEVTYTTEDLFEHIGKIIKDDCHCWLVEQIDYQPPSVVTLGSFEVFLDCVSCLSTFYTLAPCERGIPSIITNTNLSGLVGQVVQIDGCEGCYTVGTYDSPGQPVSYQGVEVTVAFPDCDECLTLTPRCSTVFNTTTEDQVYQYVDVNGNIQFTDTICSGQTSLRYCVQKWSERIPGIFNYYGDCTVFEPDRTVTPRASFQLEQETSPVDSSPALGKPPCPCFTFQVTSALATNDPASIYSAILSEETFDDKPVWELTIGTTLYYVWNHPTGAWVITPELGIFNTATAIARTAGNLANLTCPAGVTQSLALAWLMLTGYLETFENKLDQIELQYLSGQSWQGDCFAVEPTPNLNLKLAHCPQYFPNNRKVKPGYNTPICSSEKYDKITCNFAEIAYKEALALRYGISNCCPELDEKWLISKELIELQALQDPQFNCPPITDCCGNTRSNCSCNS